VAGAEHPVVEINNRRIVIGEFRSLHEFKKGTLAEKQVLAPYYLDYFYHSREEKEREEFLEILNGEGDPLLAAYARIGHLYFDGKQGVEHALQQMSAASSGDVKSLYLFHLALYRRNNGNGAPEYTLYPVCKIATEKAACNLIKMGITLEKVERSLHLSPDAIRSVLRPLQPFLEQETLPPFAAEIAREYPSRLHAIGLSLEAALLANRIGTVIPAVADELPFYLNGAGDSIHAVERAKGDLERLSPEMKNLMIDWLITAEHYDEALALAGKLDPEGLLNRELLKRDDYWSKFRFSAATLQMKFAMAAILAGDRRKGMKILELFSNLNVKTKQGEPFQYYAKLRLAQMVARENPELAHKIAEEITYVAQEKGWYRLEYYATIIDGWANYFRDNTFYSIVNFVKAAGILPKEERGEGIELCRLLGILAADNKMAPYRNQHRLIRQLFAGLKQYPNHDAIFYLREWFPVAAIPFFLEQVTLNLEARGEGLEALNYFLYFEKLSETYYLSGDNPGGVRGLPASVQWSRELFKLPYADFARRKYDFRPATIALSDLLVAEQTAGIGIKRLNRNVSYLFPFAEGTGMRLFALRYHYKTIHVGRRRRPRRVRRWDVTSFALKEEEKKELLRHCTTPSKECAALGAKMGKIAPLGSHELKVLYRSDFDIDYGSLFPKRQTSYFYRVSAVADPVLRTKDHAISPGCAAPSLPADGVVVKDFAELFLSGNEERGGIYHWPERIEGDKKGVSPYLYRFRCNGNDLRLWDLDRFSDRIIPAAVVFQKRPGEAALNRAFIEHFAGMGVALIETDGWDTAAADLFYRIYDKYRSKGVYKALRIAVSVVARNAPKTHLRFILPDLAD